MYIMYVYNVYYTYNNIVYRIYKNINEYQDISNFIFINNTNLFFQL